MKKFDFKLEPLYDYRQRIEDICRKEFSAANARLDEEDVKLEKLKEVYRSSSSEIDEMKEKGASMDEISLYYNYLIGIKKHIAGQEKVIVEFRNALEVKRGELHEASKNKRVVEIMKEKSLNAHMTEMNRQELKIADDMAVSRFKRGAGYEV